MLLKCCTQYANNLGKLSLATGLEKVTFHSNPKERQCQRMHKLPYNCTHLNTKKVMLKILQARLQQYVNQELPDIQAGFRKGRGFSLEGPRLKLQYFCHLMQTADPLGKILILGKIEGRRRRR